MRQFLFLALYLYVPPLFAQNTSSLLSDYLVENWSTDDGLPVNYITGLYQTLDGYIWVGTSSGLARFDGKEFEVFTQDEFPGWADSWITQITETPDSVLWVLSNKGHLARIKNGIVLPTKHSLWNEVIYFHQSESGNLYLLTDTGFFHLRAFSASIERLELDRPLPKALMNAHTAVDGIEYLSTHPGLFTLSPGDSVLRAVVGFEEEDMRGTTTLSNGKLWIAGEKSFGYLHENSFIPILDAYGIHDQYAEKPFVEIKSGGVLIQGRKDIFRYIEGKLDIYLEDVADFTGASISEILKIKSGSLFIVAKSGFEGKLLVYSNRKLEEMNLDDDLKVVNNLLEDHEGNVWLGTTHGLYVLKPRSFKVYTTQAGFPENQIFSVEADDQGAVWAGTWGDGVVKIDGEDISIISSRRDSANYVRASLIDKAGNKWFGSPYAVSLVQNRSLVVTHLTPAMLSSREWVHAFTEDIEGTFYIATNNGLRTLSDNGIEKISLPYKEPRVIAYQVKFSSDSTLWLTSNHGLFIRRNGVWKLQNQDSSFNYIDLNGIYEDRKGRVLIGSRGNGLLVYVDGDFRQIDIRNGLPSNTVHATIEDDNGDYWLTHENGVSRVKSASFDAVVTGLQNELDTRLFNESDGLVSAEFSSGTPSITKTEDGRLWFATLKGVAVVDPDEINHNATPPQVQITRLEVNGQEISFNRSPEFRHDFKNLKVSYAALSFSGPSGNQYKYRLRGKDESWQDITFNLEALYSSLSPGSYVFDVLGTNNSGVWSTDFASLAFSITPPLYARWWFRSLGILLSICLTFFAVYRVRKQQRFRVQSARGEERTRISRDLHEGIKTRVNSIQLFLSYLKNDKRLSQEEKGQIESKIETTTNLINDLKDIVWIMDGEKDTLAAIIYRIVDIASKESYRLRLEMDYPEEMPDVFVDARQRRHIVYFFREALANTINHSEAASIQLSIRFDSPLLQIFLRDDGKGFDLTQTASGHGLHNMRERISDLGGELEILSQPGEGTSVRAKVRL